MAKKNESPAELEVDETAWLKGLTNRFGERFRLKFKNLTDHHWPQ